MMQCTTCGHVVDYEATHCPNCGKPEPGKSQIQLLGGLLVLGLIAIVVLGGIQALFDKSDDKAATNTAPPPAIAAPADPSPTPTVAPVAEDPMAAPGIEVPAPEPATGTPSAGEAQDDTPTQDIGDARGNNAPAGLDDHASAAVPAASGFDLVGRVRDSDGYAILRARASRFSDNIGRVDAGTPVRTYYQRGGWMQVQLEDGRVGYLKARQVDQVHAAP